MYQFFFDVIGDHRTTKETSPPSIVHHVLLFYGLHITNRRSGIGQGGEQAGGRAERAAGDFVIVTCIVKSAAAAAGLEVAVRASVAAGGRGGAKCVSYGGYIEEVIPAVRDILANRRHRRIVLYPLFVAVAVESAVERPAARLQLGSIAASLSYMNPPRSLAPSLSRGGVRTKQDNIGLVILPCY